MDRHRKYHRTGVATSLVVADESSSSDIEVYSNKSIDKDESENVAQNSVVEERMTLNENVFDKIFNILLGPLTDV